MSTNFAVKKKILITAKTSYVGNSFAAWVAQDPDYSVDFISCRTDDWKNTSFSGFDVILHVAGIAHVSTKSDMEFLYYKVNRDLTIDLAKKAKEDGVPQFIFLSSILVYGESGYINKKKVITKNTIPKPTNFYGLSKLQAEQEISTLQNESFKVVILRIPMVYGKGSKGNYPKLVKLAISLPCFPYVDNERSMIYIDNLCEFIKAIIENHEHGLFYPQNKDYVKTSEMVKMIAEAHGKKIWLTKIFNPMLKLLGSKVGLINKVFGNLVYERSLSDYKVNYQLRNFQESIRAAEGNEYEVGSSQI